MNEGENQVVGPKGIESKEDTFWNGEPCEAVKVRVKVASSDWAESEGIVGTEQPTIRIKYFMEPFYIDNRNDEGWKKVTTPLYLDWIELPYHDLQVSEEVK